MRRSILLAAVLAIVTIPASATSLGPVIETWNFSGICTDCPTTGTGVLTVHQSQASGPLSFQFSYSSDWIAYTMTDATFSINGIDFTGTTFTMPTSGNFRFRQEVPVTSFGGVGNPMGAPGVYNDGVVRFTSFPSSQNWDTGGNSFSADYGTAGIWTQVPNSSSSVPEPTSVMLMGASFGGLVLARRWKQRKSN